MQLLTNKLHYPISLTSQSTGGWRFAYGDEVLEEERVHRVMMLALDSRLRRRKNFASNSLLTCSDRSCPLARFATDAQTHFARNGDT